MQLEMGKINARKKGNSYELWCIKHFQKIGLFMKAVSSRSESKRRDDAGVDICYTEPFNFQCKAVENLGSAHKVLAAMPDELNYNVVLHKKNNQGTVASMSLEDFTDLLVMLKQEGVIR
jgi:hypothetical protein